MCVLDLVHFRRQSISNIALLDHLLTEQDEVTFATENLFSNFLLGPLEKCGTCQKTKKCHILSERQKLWINEALISLKNIDEIT